MALLVAAGFLLAPLARFWNENPDYAYGWGVPVLAAYLAWERWRWRCRPEPRRLAARKRNLLGVMLALAVWGLFLLGARLALETEPASRPLLWLNTCLLAGAVLAWAGLLGGRPWLRHFAFPIAFLLAGVPWIFGFEEAVVQHLTRLNAAAVAGTIEWLGRPARAAGNTIVLATGPLGVSAACSGIRSLQATLMMSLFFGEFYRYGVRGRVGLVLAGAGLALVGNFARLLFLAWRGAVDGVNAVDAAHDAAGWLVLLFTVVSLWAICSVIRPPAPVRFTAWRLPASALGKRWALGVFAAALLAEAATQGWYGWRERTAPHYPAWSVSWPDEAAGFRRAEVPEIVRATLHASEASAASWREASGGRWSGLWIRYDATAEGKVVFESHNPGLCLPAAGWQALARDATFPLSANGIDLQVDSSTFAVQGATAHVFWISYLDGGVRSAADEGPGLYGHSFAALRRGHVPLLADIWAGCRGVRAETLELALIGPVSDATAERSFRRLIPRLIRPEAAGAPALASSAPR